MDCKAMPNKACCPPPPNPCKKKPVPGNATDEAEILKWVADNCPPDYQCPDYAPPLCNDCYDLLDYKITCKETECAVEENLNCANYCLAWKKLQNPPGDPCPFISDSDLITPENTA
ncbi:MAG: hypothetical protein FJ088_05360, partial [Deltaproteobacteria bacterium]|nr:hypothetical protein [Deltaproteobacteria bacterium]